MEKLKAAFYISDCFAPPGTTASKLGAEAAAPYIRGFQKDFCAFKVAKFRITGVKYGQIPRNH
jgi:hypothetical protein